MHAAAMVFEVSAASGSASNPTARARNSKLTAAEITQTTRAAHSLLARISTAAMATATPRAARTSDTAIGGCGLALLIPTATAMSDSARSQALPARNSCQPDRALGGLITAPSNALEGNRGLRRNGRDSRSHRLRDSSRSSTPSPGLVRHGATDECIPTSGSLSGRRDRCPGPTLRDGRPKVSDSPRPVLVSAAQSTDMSNGSWSSVLCSILFDPETTDRGPSEPSCRAPCRMPARPADATQSRGVLAECSRPDDPQ